MHIQDLPTPALLIDRPALQRNTARMAARAAAMGVDLRAHVKTHKVPAIGRMQLDGRFRGITVSTLAEAAAFFAEGFEEITYAVPFVAQKLEKAASLMRRGGRLRLLTDSLDVAREVQRFAVAQGLHMSMLMKVDCGYGRAGIAPDSPKAVELARYLAGAEGIDFCGVLTHAGHSYATRSVEEVKKVAWQEKDAVVGFARRLKEDFGIICRTVSVGSTPTCMHAEDWTGVTEIRPGNYVFFDWSQVELGSCVMEDVAATVIARVIAHHPERGQMLIDAGALALSKDLGVPHLSGDDGYGRVLGFPDLRIVGVSQEHGFVRAVGGDLPFGRLPIGSLVRIVPNHSCMTAALFPRYHLVEGDEVVGKYAPVRGW